jgi:tRNA(Ile)-lysidine synthase
MGFHSEPYPQPGPVGGRLIREVIALLKDHQISLPLNSHILIASSGGLDSTALGLLISKYGRRIAHKGGMSLLHINHGWRGVESDEDEQFVRGLGEQWGLPVIVRRMSELPPSESLGQSAEDLARRQRKYFCLCG